MPQRIGSRRGFLRHSTAALTLGAGLPAWYARDAVAALDEATARPRPRAEKLRFAAIGTGSRGVAVMGDALDRGAECVAVCDVDKAHRADGIKRVGKEVPQYEDFREILDRKDIDFVTVVVPDHWHALVSIAAMKAGRDVYCEKPLTLTIDEGKALVKVARDKKTVFQTGSQQRSDARFRLACELVRNGRLGKIQTVETRIGDNPQEGPFPVAQVPNGLNWDTWMGPTPEVDYVERRCHYEFRWWYEYSGGKVTDWGAHHNDIAQWGLGTDETGPVLVESTHDPLKHPVPNAYNCYPGFKITYTYAPNASKYADGTKVVCSAEGDNGVKFVGEGGWIFVDRGQIQASDVAIGHRSVTVCHLGNISLRMGGKQLVWQPEKERFFGDALANQMLSRPMRAPWKIEA